MQQKNHEPKQVPAEHTPKHPKQDFQVERIAFFSDAVFAIAITLLVIEFKIPEITKDSTYAEVWHQVVLLKYKFLSLLLSFAFITSYWMRHHLLFKHIHNYNRQIIVANMLSLLPIIFFPFTTAFFYESLNNKDVLIIPYRLFLLNNLVAGLTAWFFYWTVTKRFKGMSFPMEKEDQKEFQAKLVGITVSFLFVLVLSYTVPFEYSFIGMLPLAFINLRDKFV
jgi:uncharacterized membrane protein